MSSAVKADKRSGLSTHGSAHYGMIVHAGLLPGVAVGGDRQLPIKLNKIIQFLQSPFAEDEALIETASLALGCLH